jgi:transposase
LHATWSRCGQQPLVDVGGGRKSVKVFGCVDIVSSKFHYKMDEVFNAETYLAFLEEVVRQNYRKHIFYIQDNASYHKDRRVWEWFSDNRKWLEVFNLPPYSPEFNAAEPLWKYTRKCGTHNKYFRSSDEIIAAITGVFDDMQSNPDRIKGYLKPFGY